MIRFAHRSLYTVATTIKITQETISCLLTYNNLQTSAANRVVVTNNILYYLRHPETYRFLMVLNLPGRMRNSSTTVILASVAENCNYQKDLGHRSDVTAIMLVHTRVTENMPVPY